MSTGEKKQMIIKGSDNQMTEEEAAKRMEELSYLKIQPRDQEENRLVILQAESRYEECLGDDRRRIEMQLQKFEEVLRHGDRSEIRKEREALLALLEEDE